MRYLVINRKNVNNDMNISNCEKKKGVLITMESLERMTSYDLKMELSRRSTPYQKMRKVELQQRLIAVLQVINCVSL